MNVISKRIVSLLISFSLLIGTITSSFNIANAAGIWGNVSTLVRLVSSEGGSLSFADDGQSGNKGYYETGETVTVNVILEEGRSVDLSVTTEFGNIEYTYNEEGNAISFIKPAESVAIIANFTWGRATRLNNIDEQNVEYAFDYMVKHLNEEYVNVENVNSIVIADALLVKNTLADARKLNGIETIDNIWADVMTNGIENVDMNDLAFISQSQAPVMLYDVDPESDYYVAYANHMANDSHSRTTDWCFAYSTNDGEVVNDCIYDNETGLAYIPKKYTEEDKLGNGCLNIQMQILHVFDTNDIVADVNVIVEKGDTAGDIASTGIITSEIVFDEIYIQLAKDDTAKESINPENICVVINDLYYEFSYNTESGILAIPANPASSDEIHIFVDGKSEEIATNSISDKIINVATSLGFINVAHAGSTWKTIGTQNNTIMLSPHIITVSGGAPQVDDTWMGGNTHYGVYMAGNVGSSITFNTGTISYNNSNYKTIYDDRTTYYSNQGMTSVYTDVTGNTTIQTYTGSPKTNDIRQENHIHYYGVWAISAAQNDAASFIYNGSHLTDTTNIQNIEKGFELFTIISNGHKGVSNGRTYTYDGWFNNSSLKNSTSLKNMINNDTIYNSLTGNTNITWDKSFILPLQCSHISTPNLTNNSIKARVMYVQENSDKKSGYMYIGYITGQQGGQCGHGIVKYQYFVEEEDYYSGISVKKAGSISGTETNISGAATFAVLETSKTNIIAGMIAEVRNYFEHNGGFTTYQGAVQSHMSSTFGGNYAENAYILTSTNGNITSTDILKNSNKSTRYYWVFELAAPSGYTLNADDIYRIEVKPTTNTNGAGSAEVTRYIATDHDNYGGSITATEASMDSTKATLTNASGSTLALLTIKNEEIPIYFDAAKAYSDGGAVAERMYFKNYYRYKEEGAVYKLEIYNCNSSNANIWLPLGTGVTNKDGKIEWTGLNAHATNLRISATDDKLKLKIYLSSLTGHTCTLRVTEITPPPGYTKATGVQSIAEFSSDYSMSFNKYDGNASTVTVTEQKNSPLYDYSKKVSLYLEKSLTGYNLSDFNGAEFDLYMTPFHINALTEGIIITPTNTTRTPSIKSDTKSGYYFDDIIYKVGTFKIENGNIKATANPIYWKYVINTSADAQNTSANNHELFENNVAVNMYVHGAYIDSDGKRTTNQSSALSTTASVVTDTNGNQHFEKLPLGSYMLIETKSPTDGRIGLSEAPYYTWSADDITTDEDNAKVDDSYSFTHTFNVVETPNGVTLGIKKVKEDPSIDVGSIEGAEYTLLYNKDSDPVVSNRRRTKNSDGSVSLSYDLNDNTIEKAVFVIGSDGIGRIKGTNDTTYIGDPGRYMFIETKAPKNYKFDTSIETVHILSAGDSLTSDDLVSREPAYADPLALSLEKTSDSSKPMTGAEFTVQFYEGAQELSDIVGKNPSRVLTYTINSNNKVNFRTDNPTSGIMYDDNEFPIGLGVITETKAPTGYDISTSWTYDDVNYYIPDTGVVFSIRENSTNTKADSYLWNGTSWTLSDTISSSLNVDEPLETGKFNFTKYLDGTTRVLPNVSFNLYYSITEPNISNYSTTMSKLTTNVKTGTDGKYQSDNLETGWYVLEEVRCDVNEGMELINPIKFEITKSANKNLNDSSTIINYQPSISTQEWDGDLSIADYKTHMSNPDNDVKIVDKVNYSNLENKTYTMKAIIMDITDNTAKYLKTADQKTIQAQKSFIANSTYVDVNFASFSTEGMYVNDTQLNTVEGRKFVIYEFLFEGNQEGIDLTEADITNLINNTGNVENAVKTVDGYVKHADMSDIDQIGYFPEIHTLESDTKSLNHVSVIEVDASNKEKITVKDVLTYSNLDTNLTYTIRVQVREKSTNTVIKEDTSKTFKPTTSNGTYTINDLTFEAVYGPDNTPVDEFYITEELFVGPITDNKLAASHTLPIEDQSGMVARIRTFATTNVNTGETENDVKSAYASKNVTLTDTLYYKNLNDETYTIECVYKYVGGSKDGQVVKDATGTRELRVRKENVQLSDGSITLSISGLNLTHLKNETIMAYETIYWTNSNNETIAIAKEVNFDANQSIKFVTPVIRVNKVDQFGNGISGATLEIRKDTENGQTVKTIVSKTTATIVDDLVDGTYYLVETKSPSNYSLNESIKFVIDGGVLYINGEEVDTATITMVNYNLTVLPTAGDIGTLWFTLSGLILMLGAILFKKKYMA